MSPLMALHDLAAGYGRVTALEGVTLEVAAGSITALIGANGAGKSTLMRTVAGLLAARSGSIVLDGIDITRLPSNRRVEGGIALVPEGRLIFADFTVEENLRIGAFAPHARAGLAGRLAEVFELFPQLHERRRQRGGTLSGGEQQMLALGRGLMSGPRLLLLDEPSLGLAPLVAKVLFELITRVRQSGITILLAEQDVRRTLSIADQAYVLENGRRVMAGSGRELLDDPLVKQTYLGL